jgi:NADPH2:quinone reductase
MRAAFYTRQGPAREVLQIGAQPTPDPGPGEVRVKLRTSGVNPSDWKVRRGGFGRALGAPLIIPHSDGAGDIDAIGSGVPRSTGRAGLGVERTVEAAAWHCGAIHRAAPRPRPYIYPAQSITPQAPVSGIPALTAIQAVRLARIAPGAVLLVAGGAGAVAHYVIQLAKLQDARVVATVSNDEKGGARKSTPERMTSSTTALKMLQSACRC